MLDIASFRAQVNDAGYAVQNRYDITIPTLQLANASTAIYNANAAILQFSDEAWDWMSDYYGGDPGATALELQAYCQQSELPSYQFQMETNRSYGPSYKIPHKPEYQDLTMTFMCGQAMNERWFFDAWMYMVMDPETNMFNYIDEYSVDIGISQLPDVPDNTAANAGVSVLNGAIGAINQLVGGAAGQGQVSYTVSPNYYTYLIDAFPIAIAQQPLAYANNNVVQTIQVTFTYKYAVAFDSGSIIGKQVRSANGQNVPFASTITPPTYNPPAPQSN